MATEPRTGSLTLTALARMGGLTLTEIATDITGELGLHLGADERGQVRLTRDEVVWLVAHASRWLRSDEVAPVVVDSATHQGAYCDLDHYCDWCGFALTTEDGDYKREGGGGCCHVCKELE